MANLGNALLTNSGLADKHRTYTTKSMRCVLEEVRSELVANEKQLSEFTPRPVSICFAQAGFIVYCRVITRGIFTRHMKATHTLVRCMIPLQNSK